jgi:hypothetical protein
MTGEGKLALVANTPGVVESVEWTPGMAEIDSDEGRARIAYVFRESPVELRRHGRGKVHLYVEGDPACHLSHKAPAVVEGDPTLEAITCPTCTFLFCVCAGVYRGR